MAEFFYSLIFSILINVFCYYLCKWLDEKIR